MEEEIFHEDDIYGPAPVGCVKCYSCCFGWAAADSVEFVNIEEDIYGRDVMTFVCPSCQNQVKSLVVVRNPEE